MRWPIAISVEVHADLAASAEWQENELSVLGFVHQPQLVFLVAAIDL
jgi:hypothetical protein